MPDAYINPDRQALEAFKAIPADRVVHMLNLIRLRALADYPADHPNHGEGLTGRQAYELWGRTSAPIFKRVGGRQIWLGHAQTTLIGPRTEAWDLAFIAEYPNTQAFMAMNRDPGFPACVAHRTAAVADTRLICVTPVTPGEGFGLPVDA